MAAASMTGTSCAVVLRELRATLNGVIETGKQTGSLKTEAARNVILALENVRNAFEYNGVLLKEEDEVDTLYQERLTTLRGMVTAIRSGTNEVFLNIPGRVQALISSLALPRWQPCLVGVNPQYVAVVNVNEFIVSFLGKFKYGPNEKYKPFLTLSNRQFDPVEATADRLTFKVTHTFQGASCDHRDLVEATLTVPFENGKVLYDRRVFTYSSAGSATLSCWEECKSDLFLDNDTTRDCNILSIAPDNTRWKRLASRRERKKSSLPSYCRLHN